MKMEVYMDDLWNVTREDIREHLGYDGLHKLLEYYEDLEEQQGEPIMYDPSLFWNWERGELRDIYAGYYGDDDLRELEAECFEEEANEEDAKALLNDRMEEYLRNEGQLIEIGGFTNEWLFSDC